MRLFLLIIAGLVGVTYGYGYALVLWIVGRIVIVCIAKGAESSERYQTYDSHNYQSGYRKDYQHNYQRNNTDSGGHCYFHESMDMDHYYALLGITSAATDSEVKMAFRKKAMECHPDRCAGGSEEECKLANEKFRIVNEAYEAIKMVRQMK